MEKHHNWFKLAVKYINVAGLRNEPAVKYVITASWSYEPAVISDNVKKTAQKIINQENKNIPERSPQNQLLNHPTAIFFLTRIVSPGIGTHDPWLTLTPITKVLISSKSYI